MGLVLSGVVLFVSLLPNPPALIPVGARSAAAQGENEFYRTLARKPIATREDVIRCVARLGGYRGPDQVEREIAYVKEQGIKLGRAVERNARAPVTKGESSRVILSAMRGAAVQRGLLGRIFTGSRRYAARDAMAQEILPTDSYMNEFMTGGELLSMLSRAVDQMGKKQ